MVKVAENSPSIIRTTVHGAEKIAGAAVTRGGVLAESEITAVRVL
jgi:hypothetical protein